MIRRTTERQKQAHRGSGNAMAAPAIRRQTGQQTAKPAGLRPEVASDISNGLVRGTIDPEVPASIADALVESVSAEAAEGLFTSAATASDVEKTLSKQIRSMLISVSSSLAQQAVAATKQGNPDEAERLREIAKAVVGADAGDIASLLTKSLVSRGSGAKADQAQFKRVAHLVADRQDADDFMIGWSRKFGVPYNYWKNSRPNEWKRRIQDYWDHRRDMSPQQLSQLHSAIDTHYYELTDRSDLPVFPKLDDMRDLHEKHNIPPSEHYSREGSRGRVWMMVAAVYMLGVKYRASNEARRDGLRRAKQDFTKRIPPSWLDDVRDVPREQMTPYEKFVTDLSRNWGAFVRSYNEQTHAAPVDGTLQMASIQSFIEGRNRKPGSTSSLRTPTSNGLGR